MPVGRKRAQHADCHFPWVGVRALGAGPRAQGGGGGGGGVGRPGPGSARLPGRRARGRPGVRSGWRKLEEVLHPLLGARGLERRVVLLVTRASAPSGSRSVAAVEARRGRKSRGRGVRGGEFPRRGLPDFWGGPWWRRGGEKQLVNVRETPAPLVPYARNFPNRLRTHRRTLGGEGSLVSK